MSGSVQKVAVIGSSKMSNDAYCDEGRGLGADLARGGYQVILPGDLDSIKGDVMIGALDEGGDVVNVYTDPGSAPFIQHPPNLNDGQLKERTMVEGRQALKKSLDTRVDVAVLLPGGIEEFDQAMHLARRGTPLVVVNMSAFYAGLEEQLGTVKENRLAHEFPGNDLEHVHFVNEIEEVAPILDLYGAKGTPEYDYAQRWSQAKAEDRVIRLERGGDEPGFTYREKSFMLSTGAGVMSIASAAKALADEPNVPMEINNDDGYFDGLIAQLQNYVDEGAEKPNAFALLHVTGETPEGPHAFMDDEHDGLSEHSL